jgi:hypothetical protein
LSCFTLLIVGQLYAIAGRNEIALDTVERYSIVSGGLLLPDKMFFPEYGFVGAAIDF